MSQLQALGSVFEPQTLTLLTWNLGGGGSVSRGDSSGLEVGQWEGGLPGFSEPLCPAALTPSLPGALCPHLGPQRSKLRVSWVWTFQPWIFKEPRG